MLLSLQLTVDSVYAGTAASAANPANTPKKSGPAPAEKGEAPSRFCDVDDSGTVNAVDVQLVINAALGIDTGYNCDLNNDGYLNALDVQFIINGALHVGSEVPVPDVLGMTQAAAESAITEARLYVGTIAEGYSDTVSAGFVLTQYPAPDIEVLTATFVNLVISVGPEPVAVPDIVGLPLAEAMSAVTSAGLTVGEVLETHSASVPAGNVVMQSPSASTIVAPDSSVDLVVSIGPEPVSVPDVVGMTQNEAESTIVAAGLSVGNISHQCSDTVPEGHVVSQDPTASTSVAPGCSVDLVISNGPEPVSVPDVVGMAQGEAEPAIVSVGLSVGNVTRQYSDSVPADHVVSQNPSSGSSVAPGSGVDLVISDGPAPVSVPYVLGMSQNDAESTIVSAGLTVGTVTEQYSDTVPSGDVTSQSPAFGTFMLPGSEVDLVVSKGPEPVPVPDVVGMAQAAAEASIVSAGLTVGTVTEQDSDTVPSGDVVSQNPTGGTVVECGSEVDIVISLGPERWARTFGGYDYDYAASVAQTSDGGYILAGVTFSSGAGSQDAYLVKTDSSGVEQWSNTFGGADHDYALSVAQTSDGGFVLAGSTESFGAGSTDAYLVKPERSRVDPWPNPSGGAAS